MLITACATAGCRPLQAMASTPPRDMAADRDARAIDEGLRQQRRHQRIEIAQGALGTRARRRRFAAVALRTVGAKPRRRGLPSRRARGATAG
jgi:hypothetical protein